MSRTVRITIISSGLLAEAYYIESELQSTALLQLRRKSTIGTVTVEHRVDVGLRYNVRYFSDFNSIARSTCFTQITSAQ